MHHFVCLNLVCVIQNSMTIVMSIAKDIKPKFHPHQIFSIHLLIAHLQFRSLLLCKCLRLLAARFHFQCWRQEHKKDSSTVGQSTFRSSNVGQAHSCTSCPQTVQVQVQSRICWWPRCCTLINDSYEGSWHELSGKFSFKKKVKRATNDPNFTLVVKTNVVWHSSKPLYMGKHKQNSTLMHSKVFFVNIFNGKS